MRTIQKNVEEIDEELCGAKKYAEMYIEYKARNESQWASKFKSMAQDELNHAMIIHELAIQKIDELNKVFVAPEGMQEKWDKAHKEYVEKAAWIRQMLAM